MKSYEIWPNVLYQRGRTNRVPVEHKRQWALDHRLGLVVQLCRQPDIIWQGFPGVEFLYCPVPDGRDVRTIHDMMEYPLSFAARTIGQGRAVLSFCNAGRNRSSLFSGLLLNTMVRWRDWPPRAGEELVAFLRRCRPNAFGNEAMAEYLRGLP